METYIFGVAYSIPLVMLWLNIRSLQNRFNSASQSTPVASVEPKQTNNHYADVKQDISELSLKVDALAESLSKTTEMATFATTTLNNNARKFGLPYLKTK